MENKGEMKRFLLVILTAFSALVGCQKQEEPSSSYKEPFYNEVENLHVEWANLFDQEDEVYYTYVYSVTCTACSYLREDIISFAKSGKVNFYFVFPSEDISFVDDPEVADASLGATKIEDVNIYTTPCLMEISDHVITKYTRDYYEIKSFMESYL